MYVIILDLYLQNFFLGNLIATPGRVLYMTAIIHEIFVEITLLISLYVIMHEIIFAAFFSGKRLKLGKEQM